MRHEKIGTIRTTKGGKAIAGETEVNNTERPLFEVELPLSGAVFRPRSAGEIRQFLQKEREAWSWLQAAIAEDSTVNNIINHQHAHTDSLLQWIAALEAMSLDDASRPGQLDTIRQHLHDRYVNRRAMPWDTPQARFVFQLAERDKVAAAHALWLLSGQDPQGSGRPGRALQGQVLATLYTYGLAELPKYEADAWRQVRSTISNEHDALRNQAGAAKDQFTKLADDIRVLHEEQRRLFDELQAQRATAFETQVAGHKAQMENIEATFKRELSLRSAVQYLTDRAKVHRWLAFWFGSGAAIAGVSLIALAIYVVTRVFSPATNIPLHQLAVVALAATLSFWALRILVRMLLSNLHLATDMRTRATFVHTYLALIAEGAAIKDDDRKHIISLVFRPTSDGLVRDDAAPPGWLDWLTRSGK